MGGGTQNKALSQLSKEIWKYLMKNGEYLLAAGNKEADFQSRNVKDSSEWKLNLVVFQKIYHR